MPAPSRLLIGCLLLTVLPFAAGAKVNPQRWGLQSGPADSSAINQASQHTLDSMLHLGPGQHVFYYQLDTARPFHNAAPDFYLLCGLCLMLGLIRYTEPRYFALLLGAFRNAGAGRQWHDMLRAAVWPNLGMNIFFASVAGAYIYYLSDGPGNRLLGTRAPLLLPLLIAGMLATYTAKYLILRFSGWVFRAQAYADQYIFNVFLVNKIVGIVLLPFVVLIAFAGPGWREPIGIVSGVLALGVFSTRYLRSWPAFQSLVKGSRFHFFTYLCASEILPMAVLVKWLLHLLR